MNDDLDMRQCLQMLTRPDPSFQVRYLIESDMQQGNHFFSNS